jgi:hypothetical protein
MAKWGFLGAALGTAAAIAAAPFTGGASLGLLVAGGAAAGATIGSQIDSSKAAKRGQRIADDQRRENEAMQKRLRAEQDKTSAALAKERAKINEGLARGLRRKFQAPRGFLEPGIQSNNESLG